LPAYSRDDKPMGDKQGAARMVVPCDKRGGRYVSVVNSMELRDPGPTQPLTGYASPEEINVRRAARR
jgi:hypothetical protein